MKIDLQIHSTFSDGCYTPSELVELGKKHGLALMAITDHDTVEGVAEAVAAGKKLGVKVISGVEITTVYEGKVLHILGYGFGLGSSDLQKLLGQLRENRKKHVLKKLLLMNDLLLQRGRSKIDENDLVEFCAGNFCGERVKNYLIDRGFCDDRDAAARLINETKISPQGIEPREAIEVLHRAGGMAVLSHPFAPKIALKNITSDEEEQKKIILLLKSRGLDGLEVFQACHGDEDARRALALAHELDLLATAGSDWHGPFERLGSSVLEYIPFYVSMIGDIKIPDDVAQKLFNTLCP